MSIRLIPCLLICGLYSLSAAAAPCISSVVPGSVKVGWTAYKFTEKKGVKGELLGAEVISPKTASSEQELLANLSFIIDPQKVESGDAGRDNNLRQSFFKLMKAPYIKGYVESFEKDTAKVMLSMNGVSKSIAMKLKKEGSTWTAQGSIDVMNFAMKKSFDELHSVCKDLHKGADGKSKTWSTVDLTISANVTETCNKVPEAEAAQ